MSRRPRDHAAVAVASPQDARPAIVVRETEDPGGRRWARAIQVLLEAADDDEEARDG